MPYTLDELIGPLPATEAFLTTADGTRLRTLSLGSGSPVVLAHGYATSSLEWHVVARKLAAAGHRVILFDQRGHGQSTIGNDGITSAAMTGDYLTVLEHFDVKGAVIIGHSMGGFLLLRFLLAHPDVVAKRLKHAVILASFAGKILEGSPQNRLQIPFLRSGAMAAMVGIGPIGRAFVKTLMGTGYSDLCAQAFLPEFRAARHGELWPIIKAFGDEDHYPQLKNITLPCTVMVGDRDKTTPAFHTQDMARLIPGAKFVALPGAGHFANWEAADTITQVLLERAAT
jgi:pimeloyl-ACP methyl ester carboxylesterase